MSVPFKLGDRVWVASSGRGGTIERIDAGPQTSALVKLDPNTNSPASDEYIDVPVAWLGPLDYEDGSALNIGDTIAVTWGAEKYSPRQYMNFDVGPLSATTKIRPGESPDEAHARVWKWLDAQARKQFTAQLTRFQINLQDL